MNDKNKNDTLKVVFLGEASTGKTCLMNVYDKNEFNENTENSINCSFISKTIDISKGKIKLILWDTIGQEKFHSINNIYIKGADIVIFVYDTTKRSTFNNLPFWVRSVEQSLSKDEAVYAVVGNKLDLLDKEKEIKEKNPDEEFDLVKTREGLDYAKNIGAKFCETSAKEKAPGFADLIQNLVEEYYSENKNKRKKSTLNLKKQNAKKKRCC